MRGGLRYFGGASAFGFAAVWIMASLAAALVCLLAAVLGYGVGFVIDRARARRADRASSPRSAGLSTAAMAGQTPEATMPVWADALNSDLGHIYEPSATTSALSREAEYGWPHDDDTVIASGTLH